MDVENDILEDLQILDNAAICRKVKTYKKRIYPFNNYYSHQDFIDFYRIDKESAKKIVDLISDDIKTLTTQGAPIPPAIKVLATIRYLAKGAYQKDIAEMHGLSQQSMSEIIRNVTTALARRMQSFISYPTNPVAIQCLKQKFYQIARFPQCVGVIDCTQIKIKNPGGELGGRHRCRKGFYSLNVQVVSDADYIICDIVTRWRGSVHDSRIWRESAIKRKLETTNLNGGVILGDAGYANSKVLLTPFRPTANTLSAAEERYNKAHIATRNVVEKVFGQLKNKFRICFNGLNVNLNTAKNIVVSLAILHNISKQNGNLGFMTTPNNEENDATEGNNVIPEEHPLPERIPGAAIRAEFINRYFNH